MIAGSPVARIGAWLCVLVLAVLSWTPGEYMVRTDVLTGREEHFLAYLISGAIIAAAPRGSHSFADGHFALALRWPA